MYCILISKRPDEKYSREIMSSDIPFVVMESGTIGLGAETEWHGTGLGIFVEKVER